MLRYCACLAILSRGAEVQQTWRVTADFRISAVRADLGVPGNMVVARNGDILISQPNASRIAVFSQSGARKPSIGRNGERHGEFRNVSTIGFVGDSLWALDPALRRSRATSRVRFLHSVGLRSIRRYDVWSWDGTAVSGSRSGLARRRIAGSCSIPKGCRLQA